MQKNFKNSKTHNFLLRNLLKIVVRSSKAKKLNETIEESFNLTLRKTFFINFIFKTFTDLRKSLILTTLNELIFIQILSLRLTPLGDNSR